jgi:choline dehydrogenase-like flavoprotein
MKVHNDYSYGIPNTYYKNQGLTQVRKHTTIRDILPCNHCPNILTNTQITKINFDVSLKPKSLNVYDRKYDMIKCVKLKKNCIVILCGSVVWNPVLLQLSGIGDKKYLENLNIESIYDNPNVGNNMRERRAMTFNLFGYDHYECNNCKCSQQIPQKFYQKEQLLSNVSSSNLKSVSPLNSFTHEANIFIVKKKLSVEMVKNTDITGSKVGYIYGIVNKIFYYLLVFFSKTIFSFIVNKLVDVLMSSYVVQLSKVYSLGYVKITSNNFRIQPAIKSNSLASERDYQSFLEEGPIMLNIYLNIISRLSWIERIINRIIIYFSYYDFIYGNEYKKKKYIEKNNHSVCHRSGTCEINKVVKTDLSVKGVRNIYVGDVSILPQIISTNTSLTSAIIGRRLGYIIKKNHFY